MSLIASAAQSVPTPSTSSFANTTLFSTGITTAFPSQVIPSLSSSTSCYSCVIAVDIFGLQQVFWFTSAWSTTIDTEFITVTSFNASNATAVTDIRTVLGDVAALNSLENPYFSTILDAQMQLNMYINTDATLVRGTDGSVGTTSFPFGQAYAEVRAIDYRYLVPKPEPDCPVNMNRPYGAGDCVCILESWFPAFKPVSESITTEMYNLTATYYQPLPSSQIGEANMESQNHDVPVKPWDGQKFSSWLAENGDLDSTLPNWRDCAFWNTAGGPPAPKVPVAALTTTIATTIYVTLPKVWAPTPEPASPVTKPIAEPTSQSRTGQTGSSSSDDTGGSGSDSSRSSWSTATSGSSGSSSNSGSAGNSGYWSSDSTDSIGSDDGTIWQGSNGAGKTGDSGFSGYSTNTDASTSSTTIPKIPFVATVGSHPTSSPSIDSPTAVVAEPTPAATYSPASTGETLRSDHTSLSSTAINGISQPVLTTRTSLIPAPIATVGGQTISASPRVSAVFYADTALSPNGAHATIDNTEIYLDSSGLVIGSTSTIALPTAPTPHPRPATEASAMVFTAASYTMTSNPSGIAVAGTTISPGSAAVISGATTSYGSSELVIGTSTILFPTSAAPSSSTSISAPGHPVSESGSSRLFTLSGQIYTAHPIVSAVEVAGTGAALTVDGTVVSLGGGGIVTYAIGSGQSTVGGGGDGGGGEAAGGDRETLTSHPTPATPSQKSEGLGAVILGAFGRGDGATTSHLTIASASASASANGTGAVAFYSGEAKRVGIGEGGMVMGLLFGGGLVAFLNYISRG